LASVALLGQTGVQPRTASFCGRADSGWWKKTPQELLRRDDQRDRDGIPASLMALPMAIPLDGVWIGAEHPHSPALNQCAVVQATYRGGPMAAAARFALVGPMRMAYATARGRCAQSPVSLQRLPAEAHEHLTLLRPVFYLEDGLGDGPQTPGTNAGCGLHLAAIGSCKCVFQPSPDACSSCWRPGQPGHTQAV